MPGGKSVLGAFVQTRPKFGRNEENVNQAIRLASKVRADVYVFPELCNSGYAFVSKEEALDYSESFSSDKSVEAFAAFSEKRNCTVVAGLAERENERAYNSSVVIERGRVLGNYRKSHLFYREKLWFSPGDTGFRVFDLESIGCKIAPLICFDWFFPESAREVAIRGADIICHPSNLVLPGKAQQGMLTRAFENRVFVITANRVGVEKRGPKDRFKFTGKSQIVSPLMEKLACAKSNESIAKSARLDLELARNKQVTSMNGAFSDRRVEFYTEQYRREAPQIIQ